jgi:predicted outer membrane repeat protein
VSVTGGSQPTSLGGGVVSNDPLTIRDSMISGNTSSAAREAFGGGVAGLKSLTIGTTTVSTNSAQGGGGVLVGAAGSSIFHSTLSGNTAGTGGGGAIRNESSGFSLTNSVLNGNVALGSESHGGAVFNMAPMTMTSDSFTGNSAGAGGGAVYSHNELAIGDSTFNANLAAAGGAIENTNAHLNVVTSGFINNSASQHGGGIANETGSPAMVSRDLFSGNQAGTVGGALYNAAGSSLDVLTSTLVNNHASSGGGGIFTSACSMCALTVTTSTIASNSAGGGGGVLAQGSGGTESLTGSILSANSGGNCSGTFSDGGYNLEFGDNSCLFSAGTDVLGHDPLLGGLQNNGGVTQTMALGAGSPAIDHVALAGLCIPDQRATTRSSPCDVGAYDSDTAPFPSVGAVSPATGPPTGGITVTITGSGFSPTSTVKFGPLSAGSVTFISATTLQATVPASALTTVDVTVITGGLTSTVDPRTDQFTYLPATIPVVNTISPITGPTAGGTIVNITGTGFSPTSTVKFGATSSTQVAFISPTHLQAKSPPEAAGPVDIRVTTGAQTSAANPGTDQFIYS